jgi:hypothetical protein
MLIIAPSAADAITLLVTTGGLPEGAGVRLEPASAYTSDPHIVIRVREAPAATDQVVKQGSAHVFVASEVVDELNDHTLEASTTDEHVTFALTGPAKA